jgi:hypothetical protein
MQLAGLSYRSGGLPFLDAVSFSLRPQLIGRALLPGFVQPGLFSEYVAYPGIAALLLACLGAWLTRRELKTVSLLLLAGAGVFFALGAYNPVYWLLVRFVPGFDLFRAPARWLVLWALGVAALAGIGIDALINVSSMESGNSNRFKSIARPLIAGALLAIGLAALSPLAVLSADEVIGASSPHPAELSLWVATLILSAGLVMSAVYSRIPPLPVSTILSALIAIELFLAARVLPYNQLSAPAAWTSQRPAISTLLMEQQGETVPARFLSLSDIRFDPGDLREIEAIFGPHLSEDALYDYIIATKQKEILAPNLPMAWGIHAMDGFDGGILPTQDYIRFTALFLDEEETTPDGRLRENLRAVPDRRWLSLANVRYVITDKVYDVWADGIYYDLQYAERRGPEHEAADPMVIIPAQPFEATAVGLVGHVEDADGASDGSQIGTLAVYIQGISGSTNLPLLFETHLADGRSGEATSADLLGTFTPGDPEIAEYRAEIAWSAPQTIERIEITTDADLTGTLVLRGATLIDERSGAFLPLSLSPDRRVIHSGDVKIYEIESTRPRAYLACSPAYAANEEAAWSLMENSTVDGITVVVEPSPPNEGSCGADQPGTAVVTSYAPERITVEVDADGQGVYLILADAWYPGWSAEIDGETGEIRRANGLFRAIPVPSGAHQVIFSYRSRPFEIGAVISSMAVIIVGFVLVLIRPRRRT